MMNNSKSFYSAICILIIFVLILSSCKENKNLEESGRKDLDLKEKELALKEKDIKLKEEELLRKREENIEKKEKEQSFKKDTDIRLEGKYEGSIKDGTYWAAYFFNFNGRNFTGYNIVYWENHPEGFKTNFSGEFNSDNNSVIIYEDRNAKGAGTFNGTVSPDGNRINGSWYRYSDGGSYMWNLKKNE